MGILANKIGIDELYCSEFIYFIFGGENGPFKLVRMDFGEYYQDWEKLLQHPPPQGEWGISPEDLFRSDVLTVIN